MTRWGIPARLTAFLGAFAFALVVPGCSSIEDWWDLAGIPGIAEFWQTEENPAAGETPGEAPAVVEALPPAEAPQEAPAAVETPPPVEAPQEAPAAVEASPPVEAPQEAPAAAEAPPPAEEPQEAPAAVEAPPPAEAPQEAPAAVEAPPPAEAPQEAPAAAEAPVGVPPAVEVQAEVRPFVEVQAEVRPFVEVLITEEGPANPETVTQDSSAPRRFLPFYTIWLQDSLWSVASVSRFYYNPYLWSRFFGLYLRRPDDSGIHLSKNTSGLNLTEIPAL